MSKKNEKIKTMRQLRDAKVRPHLEQYAPVWLVNEVAVPEDETLVFDVVFVHPKYQWVTRRYRYDAYNNVLYYNGQTLISEEDFLNVADEKPYLAAETDRTVNAYGG